MSETSLMQRGQTAAASGLDAKTTERKRILLVEGDGFTRLVLLLRLRLAGFTVDFTSNGVLGLGKLRNCHPDILLVELKLCGLSGLELIKAARAEASFGDRPIYVFTHAERMSRTTRKELGPLDTKVFDKGALTREDLVQIFASTYLTKEATNEQAPVSAGAETPETVLNEVVVSGAIGELVAGVREQSEVLMRETADRATSGGELLSRVSSLTSCAKAAKLPCLTRHAQALEKFLSQLCKNSQDYTESALSTVTRAVEVMSSMSFEGGAKEQKASRISAVFIDESPYSNRAMEEALLNAGFQPVCFEDPGRAREYLADNRTELIIANVALPEAHGLAKEDIRHVPLQVKTPVLFGPEPSANAARGEELPGSAPRLDKVPLLLTELVVKALNEVQAARSPGLARPASPAPKTGATKQPAGSATAAASLSAEDGFDLFARTARPEAPPAAEPSAETSAVSVGAINLPNGFKHLFNTPGLPTEPILRAKPSIPEDDSQTELMARLPEIVIDETQVDERPVETLPVSTLQTEDAPQPEQEALVEHQTVESLCPIAVDSDPGQSVLTPDQPELEQNHIADVQDSAAATANDNEVMNRQLQAAPTDYVQQPEANQQDLAARVCASEMALYRAQMEIERRDKTIEALQRHLTESGQAVPGEPASAGRCAELEQEVAALRQALEGLGGVPTEPLSNGPEAAKQLQELEQRLSQNAAELAKEKEERTRLESELRQQLEAANTTGEQKEAARQQAETRCAKLEQQLESARQAWEELRSKQQKEQKVDGEPGAPASESEQQVRQDVAALAHATAELAKERGERQRSQQLATDLSNRLQALHVDLSRTLQTQGENLSKINALEQQQNQSNQALHRINAELEQQQAERFLAEEQLQKTKEANVQLRKDLSFFEEANHKFVGAGHDLHSRLEATLNAVRENETRLKQETAENQRLTDSLEEARRDLQNQARRQEALERELQATREALQDREAKLQKQAAERQRLNEAQDSVQNSLLDRPERDLEFSKLQSALQLEQIERQRQESQLARTRQSALEAAHAARALRTTLRRQIREPVDNLVHSTRSLLELEMGEEQKKIAEAVLQDVLLVQTRLREPAPAPNEALEAGAPANKTIT